MNKIILIMTTLFLLAAILIVAVLNIIQGHKNKKIKKRLEQLEIEKNKIDSAPIMPELSKIEAFLKNEKIEILYNDWKNRLNEIKNTEIPKITDMLLDADYSVSKMDYKNALYKIAKLEMQLYKVRQSTDELLDEIKEITTSEERNRAIITKLKANYRELYQKYNDSKSEYGDVANSVNLQFENIAKRFEDFERVMENNEYTEVTAIIKAIDEMLKHMTVVVEEVPVIILMADSILPKRIKEASETYSAMLKSGYPLDYLNVEYNINEANKKISDIKDRAKVLNLEDSLFELKILLEYFDGLFNDFEKEKNERKAYEDASSAFKIRLEKMQNLLKDIFKQIDDIKTVYNLSPDDMQLLNEVNTQMQILSDDYKTLIDHTGNNTFAFSKLTKEIELLVNRLILLEDKLDTSLNVIGSMKEDEVRARQQLEEIKSILKDAKHKIREYNFPVIPQTYYVELNEANEAIKEIVKELDKKPITISVLNTRVDTARDLVLKLYSRTKDLIKTARFSEMAIVYGNRYRSSYEEIDKHLNASEVLFNRGEYTKSLELTINVLNRLEPGIYDKLTRLYQEQK